MSVLDLIPPAVRSCAIAMVLLVIASAAAGGAWVAQDWRYGQALEKQARTAAEQATARVDAVLATLTTEQAKRLALEGRLKTNDETHYGKLSDAQKAQQLLASSLATANLRLSVLLSAGPFVSGGDGMPAAAGPGGVVHGGTRAELDPAHAQRIIEITGGGDRGLIALAACQGYVREVIGKHAGLPPTR